MACNAARGSSRSAAVAVTGLCLLVAMSACDRIRSSTDEAKATPTPSPADPDSTLADLRRLYERARASGERVPADLYAWAEQDMAGAGSWEYKVLTFESHAAPALQRSLDELGRERWECVGLSTSGDGVILILKRPVRSYLGQLRLADVLRLLPFAKE